MLKMYIELDENRLKRDGLDVEEKWKEIENIISEIDDITMDIRGIILSEDFGSRSWLNEVLEETEWFMKYVCRWEIADPNVKDDVIEALRGMGVTCSYE